MNISDDLKKRMGTDHVHRRLPGLNLPDHVRLHPLFTILRTLGFTVTELLRRITAKQLFNFGIPLAVSLVHSYFAVQSGWFLRGTELWMPMTLVMVVYSIYGHLVRAPL